jgi:hypothetical protein
VSASRNPGTGSTPSKLSLDQEEAAILKRLPPKLPKRANDVYVTNKTAFKAQLDRYSDILFLL